MSFKKGYKHKSEPKILDIRYKHPENRLSETLVYKFSKHNCLDYFDTLLRPQTVKLNTFVIEGEKEPQSGSIWVKKKVPTVHEPKITQTLLEKQSNLKKKTRFSKNNQSWNNPKPLRNKLSLIKRIEKPVPLEGFRKSMEERNVSSLVEVFRGAKERIEKIEENRKEKKEKENLQQSKAKNNFTLNKKKNKETVEPEVFTFQRTSIPLTIESKNSQFHEHYIDVEYKVDEEENLSLRKTYKKIKSFKNLPFNFSQNELKNRVCSWSSENPHPLEMYPWQNSDFMQNFNRRNERYHLSIFGEPTWNHKNKRTIVKSANHKKSISMLEQSHKPKNYISVENEKLLNEEILRFDEESEEYENDKKRFKNKMIVGV